MHMVDKLTILHDSINQLVNKSAFYLSFEQYRTRELQHYMRVSWGGPGMIGPILKPILEGLRQYSVQPL